MGDLTRLDDDLAEVIERCRRACEQNERRERERYTRANRVRPTGHDVSEYTREDRRRVFQDALAGRSGGEWQRVARFNMMNEDAFCCAWERFMLAPPDGYFEALWPGWHPPEYWRRLRDEEEQ